MTWREPGKVALIVAMAVTTAALAFLLLPFVYVLAASAITVIAVWPLHTRVVTAVRGHTWVASGVTTTLIALLGLTPITIVLVLFVGEARMMVGHVADAVESGEYSTWIGRVSDDGPVQDTAVAVLRKVGDTVPAVLQATLRTVIGALLYVVTTAVLLVKGPDLLRMGSEINPIAPEYQARLSDTFVQISRNLVVGTFAIAAIQGVIAGLGFFAFGVDRVVFFAVMTSLCSLVPFIGTTLVWVPLVAVTAAEGETGRAVGLAVWSLVATTQIDNLVRPFLTRGSLKIHPLLIALAAFGGLRWMGVPGALLGPFAAAAFVALYPICREALRGANP